MQAMKEFWNCSTFGEVINKKQYTVKPFNLAALKVGNFTFKIILASFILAKFKPHNSNTTHYTN